MKKGRYIHALPKPTEEELFDFVAGVEDCQEDASRNQKCPKHTRGSNQLIYSYQKPETKASLNEIVISDTDEGESRASELVFSSSSSSDEESSALRNKRPSRNRSSRQRKKRSPKSNARRSFQTVNSESDSDDSDVPLLNIEEYTANDPALKKIRETQKLLLRKREEMLKQENEAKIQARRKVSPVKDSELKKFTFSQSTIERTEQLLRETEANLSKEDPGAMEEPKIQLKFRMPSQSRKENVLLIYVKPNEPLEHAIKEVSTRIGKSLADLKFTFDGEIIDGCKRPIEDDMESGDIIDVNYG